MTLSLPLTGTLDLSQDRTISGLVPGTVTNATLTFDATGRITSASSGTAGGGGRTMLTANVDWYVSATGSNSNPGTAALPFADPAYAYKLAQQTLDLAGKYTVTCHLQGNFSAVAWKFYGPLTGAAGPQSFIIQGTGAAQVVAGAGAGAFAINAGDFAGIRCTNFSMVPGGGSFGYVAQSASGVIMVDNAFGNTNGCHAMFDAAGSGSYIRVTSFMLTGNAGNLDYVAVSEDGALIVLTGAWVMNGGPGWNTAFVQADLAGMLDCSGFTCTGAASGVRFNALPPGLIFTGVGSSPPNFFPGSSPGNGVNPWYQ